MNRRLVAIALALWTSLAAPSLPAQAGSSEPAAYRVTERSDFSLYRDGRYAGHAYRETRGSVAPLGLGPGGAASYEARYYLLEETLRDMRSAARGVDRSGLARFSLLPGGAMEFEEVSAFPRLRNLPALPSAELETGLVWTAPGELAVDLGGATAILPFLAEYRCLGSSEYSGRAAIKLGAKFALRYRALGGGAPKEHSFVQASGTHDLEIFLDAANLDPIFIRDRFDETYVLASGGSERRSGFALIFYEGSVPLDRASGLAAIRGVGPVGAATVSSPATPLAPAQPAPGQPAEGLPAPGPLAPAQPVAGPPAPEAGEGAVPPGAGPGPIIADAAESALDEAGVELGESSAGIVLRVRDLRFVADSEELLESETWRLDTIAEALAALPGRRFLVEGHSASVGKASGELELSKRRAARVAEELVARGIDPRLVMYRGLGSSIPLFPNDREEGRAANRRVEINVLDY